MKKTLEDALYDLNDMVQRIIEDYDTAWLGDDFQKNLMAVDRLVTELCITHDVATM